VLRENVVHLGLHVAQSRVVLHACEQLRVEISLRGGLVLEEVDPSALLLLLVDFPDLPLEALERGARKR